MYQKKTFSLLAGSVNINPPGDLIPENDALVIQNWRANTAGYLQSRLGMVNILSLSDAPTSILRTNSATSGRFVGAGGSLYLDGTGAIASGFGTDPIEMCSFQNRVWATTQANRGQWDGTGWRAWGITAPSAAPTATLVAPTGGAAGLTGDYEYYVTFLDSTSGQESSPSPVLMVSPSAQAVDLGAIPTYTGPGGGYAALTAVYRNIYRSGGAQTDTVRIAQLTDNTTTTYTDQMTDVDAEEAGIAFNAADNDGPPAAALVVGPYFDRLLMANSAAHPARFWWSKQGQPSAFPGANIDEGNWADVGDTGEAILAISLRPLQATFYKANSIWRLWGDPGDPSSTLERIAAGFGLVARKAWTTWGGLDYFQTSTGIMKFNGETATPISAKLDPLFRGEYPDTYRSNLVVPLDLSNRAVCCMGTRRGRIYWSYPQSGSSENSATLVYDIATAQWVNDSRGFTALCDEGDVGELLAGIPAGLVALENGYDDVGTAVPLDFYSHFSDQGAPENEKMYADLVLDFNSNLAGIGIEVLLNNGQVSATYGPFVNSQRGTVVIAYGADGTGLRGFNHALRVTHSLTASETAVGPVFLYKATLHYYELARRAKTYDSDVTDLGTRETKFCDFLELDIEVFDTSGTAGVITYNVLTDRPTPATGAALASRATGTFGVAAAVGGDTNVLGRRSLRIPLAEFEGQLFRVLITADANTTFLLYSVALRVRPIGVYLDGANGESFRTKEIAIGL